MIVASLLLKNVSAQTSRTLFNSDNFWCFCD